MSGGVENFPSSIKCNIEVLNLAPNSQGSAFKFKDAIVSLGRDSFRDLVLLIEYKKECKRFRLAKELKFYRTFAKEGKAGIEIPGKTRFLINNAAPQPLISFLSMVALKNKKTHQTKGFVASANHRLVNGFVGSGFEEISPLTTAEVNAFGAPKPVPKPADDDATPKKPVLKRGSSGCAFDNNSGDFSDTGSVCSDSGSISSVRSSCSSSSSSSSTSREPLNAEQQHVINCVLNGQSIFFTGSAGTGKSFLLKRLISHLPPETTVVTASTGMAACQISGGTLHSFAGIGTGEDSFEACAQRVWSRPAAVKNYKRCKVLIIDEISMIDGDFFDKVEYVARSVRGNDRSFGGIQLVLSGDFLQLPPVSKPGEAPKKFCFEAETWSECIQKTIELKTVKRQSDAKFIKILQLIRIGQLCDSHKQILMDTGKQTIEKNGIKATILCTHKEDSNAINESRLSALEGDASVFNAVDVGDRSKLNTLTNAPDRLVLKIGAQVMLTKNFSVSLGLVNGARGVVTGFNPKRKNYPVVKFISGAERTIEPAKWTVKGLIGGDLHRTQLPLTLAWSISIHKSQGMTLDCVSVSLSKVFESGQAYVALSRAKSLDTIKVLDLADNSVRANQKVVQYYVGLRKRALEAKNMQPIPLGSNSEAAKSGIQSGPMFKRLKTI